MSDDVTGSRVLTWCHDAVIVGGKCWQCGAPVDERGYATPDRAANDRIVLELIDERDRAETMADELAATIGAMLGVDLGEHTSGNDPWQNALDAAAQRRS